MAATFAWPRQPRAGCPANSARAKTTNGKHWVEVLNTANSYVQAIQVTTLDRAKIIAQRLNDLFAKPGADLEFITPGWEGGNYVVLWSGTRATKDKSIYTNFGTPKNLQTTYENLYCGCYSDYCSYEYSSRGDVTVIATVTNEDIKLLGKNPWEIALLWANGIRSPINGWNCAKDCTEEAAYEKSIGLKIPQLKTPQKTYSDRKQVTATFYGAGELQPNLTTANNEIFHCCDLTVALPTGMVDTLAVNTWIRITYGDRSVVARVNDKCGRNTLDLSSGGVAYALNCYGTLSVTISAP